MRLLYCLFSLSTLFSSSLGAQQLHKHFELSDNSSKLISLELSTKSGQSYLSGIKSSRPLEIYSQSEKDIAGGEFSTLSENSTTRVKAELTCKEHIGISFTEAVAANIFSPEDELSDVWMIKLSKEKSFFLDLDYLMGKAELDLSEIPIKRLKINSGSANVNVDYKSYSFNPSEMDTFFVKVNLGNIHLNDVNLAKAKEIITEVGFGNITMNCSNQWKTKSVISATVGAGSMIIRLPVEEMPTIIKIDSSPLCHIKLPTAFKKIGHNAYANQAYTADKNNAIQFNVNVGMGSIAFTNSK